MAPNPNAGRRRTRTEREEDLAKTARLDRMGYNQEQIADMLGFSQQQVSYDLAELRRRYQKAQLMDKHGLQQEKLAQYRDILRELYEAWERSKLDHVRIVEEEAPKMVRTGETDDKGKMKMELRVVKTKQTTTREGRLPDPRFAQLILAAHEGVRELLGIDEKREEAPPVVLAFNWDNLYMSQVSNNRQSDPSSDPIEDRIYNVGRPANGNLIPLPPPSNTNGSPIPPHHNGHNGAGKQDVEEPEEFDPNNDWFDDDSTEEQAPEEE